MSRNTLRLVSSVENLSECTKSTAIENIHRHFRVNYRNFSVDLEEIKRGNRNWKKDRKDSWLLALDNYSVDTINTVLEFIMQGRSIFSRAEPTPAQFAELCHDLERSQAQDTAPSSDSDDLLAIF
jgi:hypothetical protein